MYDTKERAYVALDEIGRWVREGQRVRVLDIKSHEDVTIAVLLPLLIDQLSVALQGEDGALQLHAWLRDGIVTTAADAKGSATVAQSTTELLPTEQRLAALEARVALLETRR